jgi:bifunctional enzyme CysN/CysC
MSHQAQFESMDIHEYLAQHERKELMRLLTCGSVDDGKSTLIGRMLYDSKLVYEDQLEAVKNATKKHGTTGTDFDPALLTDGLKAEREQGITIDVAYRYFSTTKRKFIIADCPGHEQYTRNMATGASTCDLAIILIDARSGVKVQTRRHSFIVSLLGIRHVIVAINKMDLVGYDQKVFDRIKADYSEFAAKLEMTDIHFVPMSALTGENLVHRSTNMSWYEGGTLMYLLENIHIASDRNMIDMRLPVQYVNRPNLDFRGFCGTLASGILRPGDAVVALPSGKSSTVRRIVTQDGDLAEAFPPQAITVTLADEIDISRGDVLAHPTNRPRVDRNFEAMVVWMTEEPLAVNRQYLLKHGTRVTPAVVGDVRYRMDVNTLHREQATGLGLNEIGRCVIQTARPIAFDAYKKNRQMGAFVLIDRMTNNTIAAGMILDHKVEVAGGGSGRPEPHVSQVRGEQRQQRLHQVPATVWLTGLTGSKKSEVAFALEKRLFEAGYLPAVIDGRNTRLGLSRDLNFSPEDRAENLRRAAEVARMFNETGLIAVCAFLSPARKDREAAKQTIGAERFIEVHLTGGNSSGGDAGQMGAFSDMAAEYEEPVEPALRIDVAMMGVDAAVEQIFELLSARKVVG